MLFKSNEMDEQDDYTRWFKDDPPIEGRLLGYLQFAVLIKVILSSDHCNTLIMCDNSDDLHPWMRKA